MNLTLNGNLNVGSGTLKYTIDALQICPPSNKSLFLDREFNQAVNLYSEGESFPKRRTRYGSHRLYLYLESIRIQGLSQARSTQRHTKSL